MNVISIAALLLTWIVMLPLQAARPRIACIGDSITQSNSSNRSYRYSLWKKLIDNDIPFDFVGSMTANFGGSPAWPNYQGKTFDPDHEGHWGLRADEISANLPTWLRAYTPDIALIHLGSNDHIQGQTISSTIADLSSIIGKLRVVNPNVAILLAQVIPYTNHSNSATIPQLNSQIALLAQAQTTANSIVISVDQFTGFSVDQDTFDRVHPDASGEEKMATRWANALLPILNMPPVSITTGPLPEAGQLKPYHFALAATNGHPPYQWSLAPGASLPAGLPLSQSGVVAGTALAAGDFQLHIVVTDSYLRTASKSVSLRVVSALEIWRDKHFRTRINTGDAADLFDYDEDGLLNLVEFAFGLDPKNPLSRDIPIIHNDGEKFWCEFSQPTTVAGLIYGAEWSASLTGTWTAIASTATAPQYNFMMPMTDEPAQFMRLRVQPAD